MNNQFELTKIDSMGRTRIWKIEIKNSKYRTTSGLLEGKQVVSDWTQCVSMNVDKANKTTPSQQAGLEGMAKVRKQIEKGYSSDLMIQRGTSYVSPIPKPMLAKKYDDYKDKLKFPVWTQTKIDGIRCVITKEGMFTRNGKPITSCPHIMEEAKRFFNYDNRIILDGELYNHGKLTFNEICSFVKKQKPTTEELATIKEKIKFYWFDIINNSRNFITRMENMRTLNRTYWPFKYIKLVEAWAADSTESILSQHQTAVYLGWEGLIIRQNTPYENKRTSNLLKLKYGECDEYKVLDILEGRGNKAGMAAAFLLKLPNNKTFKSNIKATDIEKVRMLKERKKIIGKFASVKYFRLTPLCVPFHPYVIAIRDYE